jgi:hypothetical protein
MDEHRFLQLSMELQLAMVLFQRAPDAKAAHAAAVAARALADFVEGEYHVPTDAEAKAAKADLTQLLRLISGL